MAKFSGKACTITFSRINKLKRSGGSAWRDAGDDLVYYIRSMKQSAKVAAQRIAGRFGRYTENLARAYAPRSGHSTYGNALEDSIKYRIIYTPTRYSTEVFISDSWKSGYDQWFRDTFGKNPPWGVSSHELAMFIHEYWDLFATEAARERARAKEAEFHNWIREYYPTKGNNHVGEKFLYRAMVNAVSNALLGIERESMELAGFTDGKKPTKVPKSKFKAPINGIDLNNFGDRDYDA